MNFRYDINGLRAIAVIAVVLFHFDPNLAPGGFAGVDVFFVISGFLMTGIIFKGLEKNSFSLSKFYLARANRILPALAVLCLGLMIFGWFALISLDFKMLGKHIVSSMSFLSNIIYYRESGYFDAASHEKWLLHTWSLSVEWQFYILYPLILLLGKKYFSLGDLKKFIVYGAIASFAVSMVITIKWPDAAYYLLPTRAWEMMAGGIAFLFPLKLSRTRQMLAELLGLMFIVTSYAMFSSETPWPGYHALLPVFGAYLVLISNRQDSLITNNIVFQKLGKWSYSIYLWHWPVVVYGYHFTVPSHWPIWGGFIAILLGFTSYKFVESKSVLSNFQLTPKVKVSCFHLILPAFILGLCFYRIDMSKVWVLTQPEKSVQTYEVLTGVKDNFYVEGECRFNIENTNDDTIQRLNSCADKFGSGYLILGDSHAIDLYGMASSRFVEEPFLVGITQAGCRAHSPTESCQYENVLTLVSNSHVFKHVIYEQAGFYLILSQDNKKGNRDMFTKVKETDEISGLSIDKERVILVGQYLEQLGQHLPVTWFGPRVEPHISNYYLMKNGCDYNFQLRPGQREVFIELDRKIRETTKQLENVNFVSQNELLKYELPEDLITCNALYWSDGDHLSAQGEIMLGKKLPIDFLSAK